MQLIKKNIRKILLLFLIPLLCALGAAFFHKTSGHKLRIGASPLPHAEILNFVKEDLRKFDIDLEVMEFTDYVTPNVALNEQQIDANFFQHAQYMKNFARERGVDIVSLVAVHVEPQGFYSQKIKSMDELASGAVIAIPNDPTNEGRALLLLQGNNIIKLKPGSGLECTPLDILENPKNLKFKELEAAQLPRVLPDVDGAVINGNYALEAKLIPIKDALLLEGADSPYANIVAVCREKRNTPQLQKLAEVLTSDKVKRYILQRYNGGVVPAF
ncbi:MAG: MetQ/NlpA family ABC transporter substrate-binding protein [Holosporaceae bacterium]|jgi:D-methionine transport system substrate-binding protein|nr:MetQ/NlpA family ABC transporter substrate-binding protein [Holosporaceae bacterium]